MEEGEAKATGNDIVLQNPHIPSSPFNITICYKSIISTHSPAEKHPDEGNDDLPLSELLGPGNTFLI